MIVNPSPKFTDQEKRNFMNYFGSSSQDKLIETNTKRIMTRLLKSWNENKSIEHPSTCAFSPFETVDINIYSIELK